MLISIYKKLGNIKYKVSLLLKLILKTISHIFIRKDNQNTKVLISKIKLSSIKKLLQ